MGEERKPMGEGLEERIHKLIGQETYRRMLVNWMYSFGAGTGHSFNSMMEEEADDIIYDYENTFDNIKRNIIRGKIFETDIPKHMK